MSDRPLTDYIKERLNHDTQWVVFEPNDERTWARVRRQVEAFLHELFRQGALQGTTSAEAYYVKCGRETTTQQDIDEGRLIIHVGFAPLKPAEFVILRIRQKTAPA